VHEQEAVHEWDLGNPNGWVVPEIKLTEALFDSEGDVIEQIYPERWHNDARGLAFFNTFKTSKGGISQTVSAQNGARYKFKGYFHAWNSNTNDPASSWVTGTAPFAMLWDEIEGGDQQDTDALQSIKFMVGIDPTGGDSPFGDDVVWSPAWAIYNEYFPIEIEVTAKADNITVFTWAENRYMTLHNDRYMTDFSLVKIEDKPLPEPPTDYGYPIVTKGSKWHPHCVGEGGGYDLLTKLVSNDYVLPYCTVIAPFPKDMLAVRNLKAISPETKFVVRLMHGTDPNINIEGPDFSSSALDYMNSLKPVIDEYMDVVEYWILWNEQDPPSHIQMAIFASECMRIADAWGIKLALMGYSTGVPEMSDWWDIWDYTDFFQLAMAGGHILALHAYCQSMYPSEWVSHMLRPVQLYDEILIPGNCVVPYICTEYSVDEYGSGGIWDHPNYPTVDSLIAEFAVADEAMSELYYCLGLSGFSMGEGWDRYDMRTIWSELGDMILAVRNRENALPTAPVEPPPTNELPVAPYDKYYNVVESDIPLELREEIYLLCAQDQQTVGPAATDAVSWSRELLDAGKSVTMAVWYRKVEDYTRWREWAANIDPRISVVFKPDTIPTIWDIDLSTTLPQRKDYDNFLNDTLGQGWVKDEGGITGLTIHHTAGVWTPEAAAQNHINRDGGTESIHYHLWIEPDGTVKLVAPLSYRLWHDFTWDDDLLRNNHIAVVLNGNYSISVPSDEMMASLVRVCKWAQDVYNISEVKGHMDYNRPGYVTVCPGWEMAGWKQEFLEFLYPSKALLLAVHGAPIYTPPSNPDRQIEHLLDQGFTMCKILHNGTPTMVGWVEKLITNGIIPIVRMFDRNPYDICRTLEHAKEMIERGVWRFEILNEPNIEWPDFSWRNPDHIAALGRSWLEDARQIIEWGGSAALPAMAPTERGGTNYHLSGPNTLLALLKWLNEYHYDEMVGYLEDDQVWLAVHVSPFNLPFNHDPLNGDYINDFCLRYYEVAQIMVEELFGTKPATISTEGGVYSPQHMDQITFPVVDGWVMDENHIQLYNIDSWSEYYWAMHSWMYYNDGIEVCSWTFTDEDVSDGSWLGSGIYDADGNPRSAF